jgi:hypothetical protein
MKWLLALFVRVALLVIWISTPLVSRTFGGYWLLPLLGIIFLPLTALTYVLVFALAGGVTGWNWLWIVMALLCDLSSHGSVAKHKRKARNSRTDRAAEVK